MYQPSGPNGVWEKSKSGDALIGPGQEKVFLVNPSNVPVVKREGGRRRTGQETETCRWQLVGGGIVVVAKEHAGVRTKQRRADTRKSLGRREGEYNRLVEAEARCESGPGEGGQSVEATRFPKAGKSSDDENWFETGSGVECINEEKTHGKGGKHGAGREKKGGRGR